MTSEAEKEDPIEAMQRQARNNREECRSKPIEPSAAASGKERPKSGSGSAICKEEPAPVMRQPPELSVERGLTYAAALEHVLVGLQASESLSSRMHLETLLPLLDAAQSPRLTIETRVALAISAATLATRFVYSDTHLKELLEKIKRYIEHTNI